MNIAIVSGDDYLNTDARALTFNIRGAPSIQNASVLLTVFNNTTQLLQKTATIVTYAAVPQVVYFELTRTETAALNAGAFTYSVIATLISGDVVTVVARAQFHVVKRAGE